MNLSDLNPPFIELPDNQIWYRIQRMAPRRDSIRSGGFILPPAGAISGRFDLQEETTAYLADSELTALYEVLFRRDARSCAMERLRERTLISFRTKPGIRLVDVRGSEERFPVLQSQRYDSTRTFAADCRKSGAHGVLYASAQHAYHGCICLFAEGWARMVKVAATPLVKPGSDRLHRSVVLAAHGAQVPVVP